MLPVPMIFLALALEKLTFSKEFTENAKLIWTKRRISVSSKHFLLFLTFSMFSDIIHFCLMLLDRTIDKREAIIRQCSTHCTPNRSFRIVYTYFPVKELSKKKDGEFQNQQKKNLILDRSLPYSLLVS